jgi:hypothetical protein
MATKLSQSLFLLWIVGGISVFPIVLGINAIARPQTALEILQFPAPIGPADQKLVDNMMRVYGARNISMGLAQGITAYFGHAKAVAWILIANSITAIVDGFVSKDQIGGGEWNHWGFLSVSFGLASLLLGAFDRV